MGAQATIAALSLGHVDTLIVSASSDAVHDDTDADASVLEGADVPHSDGTLLSEQVVRLARTTGAHIPNTPSPRAIAAASEHKLPVDGFHSITGKADIVRPEG